MTTYVWFWQFVQSHRHSVFQTALMAAVQIILAIHVVEHEQTKISSYNFNTGWCPFILVILL